jgi:hypothetical protein
VPSAANNVTKRQLSTRFVRLFGHLCIRSRLFLSISVRLIRLCGGRDWLDQLTRDWLDRHRAELLANIRTAHRDRDQRR